MVENHFKDVESVRSGQLFHIPSQPALFPLPREPGCFAKSRLKFEAEHMGWPGGWGLQCMSQTGGGGLARVPNLRVCKHLLAGVAHAGTEGRINDPAVVPVWSAWQKTSSSESRPGLPARVQVVATWYGDDSPHLSWKCAQVTGKACENGQHSGEMGGSSPWTRPSFLSVATHSRPQRATSVRSRVGIVLEDGSGVAIDWVTGHSYSSARRRLNVQSGLRKGR